LIPHDHIKAMSLGSGVSGIKIYAIDAKDLGPELLDAWSRVQEVERAYDSPFFRPEFTLLAAKIWDRVSVGIIEEHGVAVGFFPFERHMFIIGRPIVPMVSDFQGVVVQSSVDWSADQFLRGCRLADMDFSHLIATQSQWAPYRKGLSKSPAIDLACGYEKYAQSRRQSGSVLQRLERQHRQFEREIGPIRVEMDSRDPAALEWLVRTKSRQCANKGYTDTLSVPGIRRFIDLIHAKRVPQFSGMLSVLYAGDRIAAAHFGMRSGSVWHYWFPVYDESFGKYSPGLLLLLRMAQAAPDMGIRRIDLGKGDSVYKERLSNSNVDLADAHVVVQSFGSLLVRTIGWGREHLRRAPGSAALKRLYRRVVYR
jgi:CelD/BcsL family acetyltransferase involved in cellulose biosynthesis